MECAHKYIHMSLDRWTEAHWQIHQIENNFHLSDPFRYSFNSFIRCIKEVPQILTMELQHEKKSSTRISESIQSLRTDPLLKLIANHRDFIVHRGMLELQSFARIGITEGRDWKMTIRFEIDPSEDSIDAYQRYKSLCKENKVFRGMFGPDCDSWPQLYREWRLPEFENKDLLEVATEAWLRTMNILSDLLQYFGGERLDEVFLRFHDPKKIRTMEFSQKDFFKEVDGINI